MRRILIPLALTAALAAPPVPLRPPVAAARRSRPPPSKLGTVLVDGQGRTVYLFKKDSGGRSACSGACASAWPPVIAHGHPRAAGSAKASRLGITMRADGTRQVTYRGHPLYRYIGDTARGQTNGQGLTAFGARVVRPLPRPGTRAPGTEPPTHAQVVLRRVAEEQQPMDPAAVAQRATAGGPTRRSCGSIAPSSRRSRTGRRAPARCTCSSGGGAGPAPWSPARPDPRRAPRGPARRSRPPDERAGLGHRGGPQPQAAVEARAARCRR